MQKLVADWELKGSISLLRSYNPRELIYSAQRTLMTVIYHGRIRIERSLLFATRSKTPDFNPEFKSRVKFCHTNLTFYTGPICSDNFFLSDTPAWQVRVTSSQIQIYKIVRAIYEISFV